jgi:F0F1-type ATP synthase membrane subunit b/b'
LTRKNLNNKLIKMKKVLSIIAVAALSTAFVACGPSKEEMEKREKEKSDSIAAVEKAKQDSIAAVEAENAKMAEEAMAAEKMKADSIRMADSLAKHKGGKKH